MNHSIYWTGCLALYIVVLFKSSNTSIFLTILFFFSCLARMNEMKFCIIKWNQHWIAIMSYVLLVVRASTSPVILFPIVVFYFILFAYYTAIWTNYFQSHLKWLMNFDWRYLLFKHPLVSFILCHVHIMYRRVT